MDQLTNYRQLKPAKRAGVRAVARERAELWAIGSGKGGVGKSLIASAAALAMARTDRKVLLVDCNLCLPDLHHLFDKVPENGLEAFIFGNRTLAESKIAAAPNLSVLAPTTPMETFGDYDALFLERILSSLSSDYDCVIFDLPNGFLRLHHSLATVASAFTIVTTPEESTIANSYALIKLLRRDPADLPLDIVVNQAASRGQAREVFKKFKLIVSHFLKEDLQLRGSLLLDQKIPGLLRERTPIGGWPARLPFLKQAARLTPQITRPRTVDSKTQGRAK